MACDARVGVVIRRGPSKSVATLLWDRRTDEFKMGQWLKGRIYERRSDLSPDGKHFIYFAMNGKWDSETEGSWTAISRAPFLKAIALYAKGDCWNGGGLWISNGKYWLNEGHLRGEHKVLQDTTKVIRDPDYDPDEDYGGECLGVYYHRLLRDGWKLVERRNMGKRKHEDLFEKKIDKSWALRKIAHSEIDSPEGKGCYWDEHQLIGSDDEQVMSFPHWEWAELDRSRLVWAEKGKLYAGWMKKSGLADVRQLHDFTDMAFKLIKAPY